MTRSGHARGQQHHQRPGGASQSFRLVEGGIRHRKSHPQASRRSRTRFRHRVGAVKRIRGNELTLASPGLHAPRATLWRLNPCPHDEAQPFFSTCCNTAGCGFQKRGQTKGSRAGQPWYPLRKVLPINELRDAQRSNTEYTPEIHRRNTVETCSTSQAHPGQEPAAHSALRIPLSSFPISTSQPVRPHEHSHTSTANCRATLPPMTVPPAPGLPAIPPSACCIPHCPFPTHASTMRRA